MYSSTCITFKCRIRYLHLDILIFRNVCEENATEISGPFS